MMRLESSTAQIGASTPLLFASGLIAAVVSPTAAVVLISIVAVQVLNRLASYLPSPIERAIHWIHAMAVELFAWISITMLRPLARRCGAQVDNRAAGRIPILLVHGYLHDASAWVYHSHKLKQAGFGPIYRLNLGSPFHSINHHAERVRLKAEAIERETGQRNLILVGHSMGGIVSSLYATTMAPPGKVTDVITVGSPLCGTIIARIGRGHNAREMRPGSDLLRLLQEGIAASTIRFYHIATRTDQLVWPYGSAILGNRTDRQLLIDDLGHLGLLFSPRVANQMINWLT